MAWLEHTHADADALAIACAGVLRDEVAAAVQARGEALLAIAGGRTPMPALSRWAAEAAIDARVAILPTDERWVPADHPDNNLARLQACFPGAEGPRWRPLVPANPGPEPSLDTARDSLALMAAPFDVVLLGMGEDGHFASLFPNDPAVAASLETHGLAECIIGRPEPLPVDAPHPRISLTLARLLRSRRRLLLVTGERKRELIERIQRHPDPRRWPVSAMLHAPGPPVEIHWSP